ncbi:MAG TPA: diguanylate cyclase [Bryobacteraceae bacterium]|nr:diguanylate cyclase [Bryobacteraceae bacterium]
MISLKRYLNAGRDEGTGVTIRAVSLLIQGVGLHAIEQNKEDFEELRSELNKLDDRLGPKTTEPELLVIVGETLKTLEMYNRRSTGKLRSQFAELQGIISALSGAVAKMVSGSGETLARLHEIQSEVSAADQIEDLRRLKTNLSHLLDNLEREVEVHKNRSSSGMKALSEGVGEFESRLARMQSKVSIDPATGLPTRVEAERRLVESAALETPSVAVIFAVKRLKQVNLRFGYAAGDGLLERLATYMGTASPDDDLYRWSGPALLMVIRRDVPFDRVRGEMRSLVAGIPEYEVKINARVAMIVMAVGWAAFPITEPGASLVTQLDGFVASQISEDAYVSK